MVSTRKKRQSNRRLLSQLDDFDRDMIIDNAASEMQENIVVNECTNFTVGTSYDSSVVNGNVMNVKTLERCFNERIDREMSNIVDTVEDKIQNASLTAIDNIVAPKIDLAIKSINASSGREVTSVSRNSERREHVGIDTPFGSASENNDTQVVSKVNDETRHITDEVSELSVSGTHFDRQPQTHHIVSGVSNPTHHMVATSTEETHVAHHMVSGVSNHAHHSNHRVIVEQISFVTVKLARANVPAMAASKLVCRCRQTFPKMTIPRGFRR